MYVFDDSVGDFARSIQGYVSNADDTVRVQVVDSGSDELTLNDNVNISNGKFLKLPMLLNMTIDTKLLLMVVI